MKANIAVVFATVGRASLARDIVGLLANQTRRPDFVVLVGSHDDDLRGIAHDELTIEKYISSRGLCVQRNRALDAIGERAEIVVFLDDDFVAERHYLERVGALFDSMPGVVGITGGLIADGAKSRGYSLDEATGLIDEYRPAEAHVVTRPSLYGCNMSIRWSVARDLRFDERLPLYGWQEDTDFTMRLGKRGRLVRASDITGIHMGVKFGKTSGTRLGYSQVANLVYLRRKGTIQLRLARRLLLGNIAANLLRSFWPERYVDRKGRLVGNIIALRDWLLGDLNPRKIERM